ncbi:MAG: AsnC family transcriptional regulator [Salinigranum sp.]
MRDLDDTDRHILRLLLEDARRPYSEIAEHVDLSAPAVSDRIDRLREVGVIRSFTLDLDRSVLRGGIGVLVELDVAPDRAAGVRSTLADRDAVEHVFETADARVVFQATVADGDVTGLLADAGVLDDVRDVTVGLLRESTWSPTVADESLALTCAECGNTVTAEGESARIGGDLYHFCCDSCLSNFSERFDRMKSEA